MVSETRSHMFTAQTWVRLWEELYGPAIVHRRSSLSIPFTTRGDLMCDSFAGYSCHINGEDLCRQRFSEQYNMVLPEEQDITDSSCSSMGSLREKCAGTRLSTTRWRLFL